MTSKQVYIVAVSVLFLGTLAVSKYIDPQAQRVQQHLQDDREVEDTNLSIEPDTFSTHLPIININTNGQTIPGKPEIWQKSEQIKNTFIQADIQIIDGEDGLNVLQNEPQVESNINIRVRGNSSRKFDKTGYLFKFTDGDGNTEAHEVLGMESDDTWVLHGPYLDKTLMRNYMWYNISGQIMDWAPDVRYCEVFINGTYQGVYVMTEQIGVGEGRIDVTKYDEKSNMSSYIICADRESVNDVAYLDNFSSYTRESYGQISVKYPRDSKLTPELVETIGKDFSEFEKSLYSYDHDSKRYGYRNYIDTGNFVDYFIINEVTQNTDAGLYSTYFYKDITGKLKLCVWDFNNCCDNYIEDEQPMAGFFMQNRAWFCMLCRDDLFVKQVILRYRELRRNILSDEAIEQYIEDTEEYLGSAIDRNFEVWGYSFQKEHDLMIQEGRQIDSYSEAVRRYRRRLLSRLGWLDNHIEELQSYCHESINKQYHE